MNRTKALILGLFGLIIIWVLMLLAEWDDIEKDVGGRTQQTLQDTGHDWANVQIDMQGRDVTLTGTAASDAEIADAVGVAENVGGVRVVDKSGIEMMQFDPADLTVDIDNGNVSISGKMQTSEIANGLATVVLGLTEKSVSNNINVAENIAVPAWLDGVKNAIPSLTSMRTGRLSVSADQMSISGTAGTQEDVDAITSALGGIDGISSVDTSGLEVVPFVLAEFSMNLVNGVMQLTGRLGSQADIDNLISSAQSAFGNIDSSGLILDLNTEGALWVDGASSIISGLGGMENPAMQVVEGGINISATARTEDARVGLDDAIQTATSAGNIVASSIDFNPLQESNIELSYGEDGVILAGKLPDQTTFDQVINAAAQLGGDVDSGQLSIDADAVAPNWVGTIESVTSSLSGFQRAKLVANDSGVTLDGTVDSDSAKNSIMESIYSSLAGTGHGNTLALTIDVEPSANAICEQTLDNTLAENAIEFEISSADINLSSYALLDKLVDAINNCADAVVEIGGHTDNTGDEAFNLYLSEARANSVVKYLTSEGIDSKKLVAKGYGSSNPIEDNSTLAGRAKNRRIEINIITARS